MTLNSSQKILVYKTEAFSAHNATLNENYRAQLANHRAKILKISTTNDLQQQKRKNETMEEPKKAQTSQ